MNKDDHIAYWLKTAEKDHEMMHFLLVEARFVQALFFGHLYLEKVSKALWIRSNIDNIPPKTHNILKLINESGLDLSIEDKAFLIKLNQYQIESRYPEDIDSLYKITDQKLASDYFDKIKFIDKCLRKKLL